MKAPSMWRQEHATRSTRPLFPRLPPSARATPKVPSTGARRQHILPPVGYYSGPRPLEQKNNMHWLLTAHRGKGQRRGHQAAVAACHKQQWLPVCGCSSSRSSNLCASGGAGAAAGASPRPGRHCNLPQQPKTYQATISCLSTCLHPPGASHRPPPSTSPRRRSKDAAATAAAASAA